MGQVRHRMLIVMLFWSVLVAGYGYLTVAAKLALPPSAEFYTNTIEFQVFSFAVAKLPALIALLFTILGFQLLLSHAQSLPAISTGGQRLVRGTFYAGLVVL